MFNRLFGRGLCASLLGIALLAGVAPRAQAQGKATGQFMDQAVVRVTDLAASPKYAKYGYSDGISILGGWMNQGGKLSFTMDLNGGTDYLLLAGGDKDAEDVDLEILDATGAVVASDTAVSPEAIVPFTPRRNGRFTLRMTLFQSKNKFPCVCAMTVLKKDGWTVPVKNLDAAMDRMAKALEGGDNAAKKIGQRVDLRKADNQWAFYGGVLKQGDSLSVMNVASGRGDLLFVGTGDNFAQTLRVDVENNEGTKVLKTDKKAGPVSVVEYRGDGARHGLRVTNVKSKGAAVVLMGAMDLYEPRQ